MICYVWLFSHFNSKICFQTFRYANIYCNTLQLPCHAGKIVLYTNKPTLCICENKGPDQLRSNCAANQRFASLQIDQCNLKPNFKPLTICCGYAIRFLSDLVRKPEDRCCLYNVLFKQPLVIIHGDTRGHTIKWTYYV